MRPFTVGLAGALVSVACVSQVLAENWPAWRGPEGTGVCNGKAPPLKWTDMQNVRWRIGLPDRGNSTPIIWGDRVFVTQAIEKEQRRTLMCFNRADGKLVWQSGVVYKEHEPTNSQNPYCSASPVADGTRIVGYFGSAGVYCYDFSGKELWHRDLGKADSWHGSGASPVLWQDLCIVNAGPGTNASLVALNKNTGREVWRVKPPRTWLDGIGGLGGLAPGGGGRAGGGGFDGAAMSGDMAGAGGFAGSWCTPLIVRVGAHDELIVPLPSKLAGYDPVTGKELWTCAGMTEQVFASPTVSDGVLLALGKFLGGGTQVIAVKLGGRGDVTATHRLWQQRLPKECVGSPVLADGRAYLVTQFGSIVCLEISSGKKLAEKRLTGHAAVSGCWSSLVLSNGKLLVTNLAGEVFVVKPSPQLELLATNSIGDETTCASPALSDGQVFLRTYKSLWCLADTK